jgi:hypothetical protein
VFYFRFFQRLLEKLIRQMWLDHRLLIQTPGEVMGTDPETVVQIDPVGIEAGMA